MVGVNEAVSRGLSQSLDLDLEDLPTLCRGGDTISLMRAFHYFPYSNDHDGKHVREVSSASKVSRRTVLSRVGDAEVRSRHPP